MSSAIRSKCTVARRIDNLLIAAEDNRGRQCAACKTAKAEARRIRRMKNTINRRWCLAAARGMGGAVLRTSIVACGTVAFVVGLVLLVLGRTGGIELLGVAGAAWGLAAATPKGTS